MEKLLTKLASEKLSTYAAIILMFTYTFLLGRDFECSCKPQRSQCDLYIGLPFLIILLLILWTDKSFQRVCRYLCSCAGCCTPTTCNFWGYFFRHFFKAVLVSLLWVAFVYLDGDWYVCCENDHSEQQAPLACKAKDNITEKEQETIAELRNKSRVIGGITLCVIVLVALLIPLCRKFCEGNSICCKRRFLYEKLILEEEENVLKENLRKSAKDKLAKEVEEIIKDEKGDKCFNIAVKLLNPPATTAAREGNEQELLGKKKDNNQHEEEEDRMTWYQSTKI